MEVSEKKMYRQIIHFTDGFSTINQPAIGVPYYSFREEGCEDVVVLIAILR